MIDQYFGHKELFEVVLRAKTPMQFGDRRIEADEPVLYFDDIQMSLLSEQNRPIFARGGWANMPHVIWDERSEVTFQLTDGVMSSVGMSILLGANVLAKQPNEILYVHQQEGPLKMITQTQEPTHYLKLSHTPVIYPEKKMFIFYYDRKAIQQKLYSNGIFNVEDPFDSEITYPAIAVFEDKNYTIPADNDREFLVDYYYKYGKDALIYNVNKERFNGLFTLEAKFYSKDENEGRNYTNIMYMPKVRIVSNINLRLGERADPTVSTFNIIGMPETVGDQKNLIMDIIRLGEPEDEDI